MHVATAHPTALAEVEALTLESDRAFPRHAHDHVGIGRVDAGGHASWSAVGPVEALAGDLIAVNPDEMHDGRPLARRPRAWRMLYAPPSMIAHSLGRRADSLEVRFAALRDASLGRRFDAAFAAVTTGDAVAADEAFCLLLEAMFEPTGGDDRHALPRARPSAAVRTVLQRIHDAPASAPSLDELAAVAELDRYALLRRFRREVGATPHAYATQWRVRLARRELLRGHSLADAAAQAGFADQSHLTRAFARQFGLPPGRYRAASARSPGDAQ